jgi:hypothetical protein
MASRQLRNLDVTFNDNLSSREAGDTEFLNSELNNALTSLNAASGTALSINRTKSNLDKFDITLARKIEELKDTMKRGVASNDISGKILETREDELKKMQDKQKLLSKMNTCLDKAKLYAIKTCAQELLETTNMDLGEMNQKLSETKKKVDDISKTMKYVSEGAPIKQLQAKKLVLIDYLSSHCNKPTKNEAGFSSTCNLSDINTHSQAIINLGSDVESAVITYRARELNVIQNFRQDQTFTSGESKEENLKKKAEYEKFRKKWYANAMGNCLDANKSDICKIISDRYQKYKRLEGAPTGTIYYKGKFKTPKQIEREKRKNRNRVIKEKLQSDPNYVSAGAGIVAGVGAFIPQGVQAWMFADQMQRQTQFQLDGILYNYQQQRHYSAWAQAQAEFFNTNYGMNYWDQSQVTNFQYNPTNNWTGYLPNNQIYQFNFTANPYQF